MADSENSGLTGQNELVQLVSRGIVNDAPPRWTRIEAVYIAAGNWIHRRLDIQTETGPYDGPPGTIDPEPIRKLREVMYTPGSGTWFTMYLTIESDGAVSTNFDYDSRPPVPARLGPVLVDDLRRYPRSVIPEWAEEDIADWSNRSPGGEIGEIGSPHPADAVSPESGSSGTTASRPDDNNQPVGAASPGSPTSGEIRYIRIDRTDNPAVEPVTTYCEIDEDGFENRKVEIYPDEITDYAGGLVEGERTILSDDPVAPISVLSKQPGLRAREITAAEFQEAWTAAGGYED
ncbi:DUF6881 domain-containing protein [Nocardia sp. NPDC003345]